MAATPANPDKAAWVDTLTPAQQERLWTAIRILLRYLLDSAPLTCQDETAPSIERDPATEPRVMQLRLEL